ncbi:murein L,D-transpeptidase catalytic domain family protein [Brumimicrobium salinarum]|uniref:murein L,D-transpeptidase catalytic domain family protein n=1 Tax=Brumimicrobium salinarum TaxID=2058658 RepID=UPI0013FDD145|nr:murein L,D-transpeptidase catalytic domain family protein [Brumimicrobium salinarum]
MFGFTFILLSFTNFHFEEISVKTETKNEDQNKAVQHKEHYPENRWEQFVYSNYKCLNDSTLTYEAFYNGLKGYYTLKEEGQLENERVLTIVDFSQHSSKERMYVINVETFEIVKKSLCAHGKHTGMATAEKFSNISGSLQSSLGFFLTAETYSGKFDYAMRLDGLEASNSKARPRGIVVHGATYATPAFLKRNNGVLGRSYGCPALPKHNATEIIDVIKEGSCFFIYADDLNYLESSKVINQESFPSILNAS